MAIIDRTADPIHFAITPTRFPELPILTVRAVSDSVLAATDRYYRLNTKPGCVDPKAQNFDFQANFGDSSYCNTSVSHIDRAFGGLYQTCRQVGREDLCADRMIAQVNPQTGDYSCPDGYTAISIYTGTESYVGDYRSYYRTCTGWLFRSCSTRSRTSTEVSTASYETFWCVVINTPQQNLDLRMLSALQVFTAAELVILCQFQQAYPHQGFRMRLTGPTTAHVATPSILFPLKIVVRSKSASRKERFCPKVYFPQSFLLSKHNLLSYLT